MLAAAKAARGSAGGLFPSLRGATGPLIGLVVLCLFLTVATDTFFSIRNFLNVLDQISVLGIMAVGMTLVILIGGIDLAVGSVMALAMMVLGYLNVVAGVPMWLAIFGYWVPGFGASVWLGLYTPLAGTGIWIGLAVGLAIVAALLAGRWSMRGRLGLLPA